MPKLIKFDLIAAAVVVGAWAFYLLYDGSTRFDVNERITLPLLLALEATAIGMLYVVGRWFSANKKGSLMEHLLGQNPEDNTEQSSDNAPEAPGAPEVPEAPDPSQDQGSGRT